MVQWCVPYYFLDFTPVEGSKFHVSGKHSSLLQSGNNFRWKKFDGTVAFTI